MPLLVLLATTALAQDPIRRPQDDVPVALHLDVTRYAIDRSKTEGILQAYIPPSVPIDQFVDPGSLSQDGDFGGGLLGVEYHIGVENVVIVPQLQHFELIPTAGEVCRTNPDGSPALYENDYFEVVFKLDVGVNTGPGFDPVHRPADRARLEVQATAELLWFIEFDLIDQSCDIWMDPQPITARLKLRMGPPRDDDDGTFAAGIPDDGLIDPYIGIPGVVPSGCPYTPDQIASYAEKLGQKDVCLPLTIDLDDFEWEFDVSFNDVDLHCDWFLDFLLDVALSFGVDPDRLLADTIASSINPQIEQAMHDVELQLQNALAGVFPADKGFGFELDPPVDLLGTPLGMRVCTREVEMDDRGLRIAMSGRFISRDEPHPCVADYDPGGSRITVPPLPPRYPDLGRYNVPGIDDIVRGQSVRPPNPAEIVLGIDDDFLNSAMYHVWRGGLLCQQLSADNMPFDLPAGLSFNTDLLSTLSRQAFAEFFPTPKPLVLVTRPTEPPLVRTSTSGPNEATLDLAGMEIDLYAELDGRLARMVGMEVGVHAGVDVAFDGNTGLLGAQIDLDKQSILPQVFYNDLKPDASQAIEEGLAGLVETVVGAALGDALQAISFKVPTFGNIGVTHAELAAEGPIRDFLGVFGSFGEVAYGDPDVGAGCDLFGGGGGGGGCDGGCDGGSGGCEGGDAACSTAPAARVGWLLLPLLVALRRRRA